MSYCQFTTLDPAPPWRLSCTRCGKRTPPVAAQPADFKRICDATERIPGPGSHLLEITEWLGVEHGKRPAYRRFALWLDKIGAVGCRQQRAHIDAKIRDHLEEWGWQVVLSSPAWKTMGGLSADPIGRLVDLSIERAEQNIPACQPDTARDPDSCVYLGPSINKPDPYGQKLRQCYLLGECMLARSTEGIPACDTCRSRLTINRPEFATIWQDPLCVRDRKGNRANCLRDLLAGRSVFLAGGGPSANSLPLDQLERRGAWTLCINNMAGHAKFRPQAMVCTDPPEKFTDAVWRDPQIMKFIPETKLIDPGRGKLRTRHQDGTFSYLNLGTADCPNVWGVKRREWLACDETFFLDDAAPNGQYKRGEKKTGEKRTICTLLFAIRVLRYLGAREVFLLGVDFFMNPSAELTDNYSFGEHRTPDACRANNNQYAIVNDWLVRLQNAKVFARFGISFYNCNPHSGLKAFPHVPFATALERVCTGVESQPVLTGWYEKKKK